MSTGSRSAVMAHLLRESAQRSLHCHAHRVSARSSRHGGDLLIVEIQLDAEVQKLSLVLVEPREPAFVARENIRADRMLERRRRGIRQRFGYSVRPWAPCRMAHLISNTIEHRLANVGLESAGPPDLDPVEPFEHPNQRLLHEIRGIQEGPGVHREPPAGPAFEPW